MARRNNTKNKKPAQKPVIRCRHRSVIIRQIGVFDRLLYSPNGRAWPPFIKF